MQAAAVLVKVLSAQRVLGPLRWVPPVLALAAGAAVFDWAESPPPDPSSIKGQAPIGHGPSVSPFGQIVFEENLGQGPGEAKYLARGPGYTALFTASGPLFVLNGRGEAQGRPSRSCKDPCEAPLRTVVQLDLAGATLGAPVPGPSLRSVSHYLHGPSPDDWIRDVPHYSAVRYRDVYPGIDLVFHAERGRLEYDLVVAAGADPRVIGLSIAGGALPRLEPGGRLGVATPGGVLQFSPPRVYQSTQGQRRAVPARYRLTEGQPVRVELAAYDSDETLVIDPEITFSSYLGGELADTAFAVAMDDAGAVYVTGRTDSLMFLSPLPTSGANSGDFDAFVTKYDANGALAYSTYLGGSGYDAARAIGVDKVTGEAYIAGRTRSVDFPTSALPYQSAHAGATDDAFVTVLNAAGNASVYSTYLGGSGDEHAIALAVDSVTDKVVVTGTTGSSDFPVVSALQVAKAGADDVFITRFDNTGIPDFSTYFGGGGNESGEAVALEPVSGDIYLTGSTSSTETSVPPFPISPLAAQPTSGGVGDAFVARIDPTTPATVFSTYLGGAAFDGGRGIAVHASADVSVVGTTRSLDFPLQAPLQPSFGGAADGFVARFSAAGSLQFSTYLGGSGLEDLWGAASEGADDVYIVGDTDSTDFPLKDPLQAEFAGERDVILLKLNTASPVIRYATYLGGSGWDLGIGIAASDAGTEYVIAGRTLSSDFPLDDNGGAASVTTYNGGLQDGFVVALDDSGNSADLELSLSAMPDPVIVNQALTYTVTVRNNDAVNAAAGVTLRQDLPTNARSDSVSASQGACTIQPKVSECNIGTLVAGQTVTMITTVTPQEPGLLSSSARITRAHITDPNMANNVASVDTVLLDGSRGGATTPALIAVLLGFVVLAESRRRRATRR